MTKEELKQIFNEVRTQVYSRENIQEVTEKIIELNNMGDNGVQKLQATIMAKEKLSQDFLFGILEKALCK